MSIKKKSVVSSLLGAIDENKKEKVQKKMLIAAKIDDGLKERGWKKKDLAAKMGKQPSVITEWLSGTHNFTIDTLIDLEAILGISLLSSEKQEV